MYNKDYCLQKKDEEIERLKEERNRFLTIAYNAIIVSQLDQQYHGNEERLYRELGCSKEEYDEIMR